MVDQSAGPPGGASSGAASAGSPLADIPPDASVLVSGPPMTGKYELMVCLLSVHADGAIVISTRNGAPRVIEDYRSIAGESVEHVGVVDCVSHHEAARDATGTDRVKYAESPENLTRIGVKFTELYETFNEGGSGNVGVGVHSLSQLLVYSDVKKVYQFMQVLSGHVRQAGWLGVAGLDSSMVDEKARATLNHHFDGIVRTRENDAGEREFRVRGVRDQPSPWTTH